MATIFQASIDTGKLPNDWLNANIAPVYKKGNVHLPENYRPVSLTCVSCKLLDHIICKHIFDHLERNKILTTLKHGFRSRYSCETQLVATVQDLLGKFDVGAQIDMAIIVCAAAILNGSTCLLWDITTEKSGLCCCTVRITQDPYVKK